MWTSDRRSLGSACPLYAAILLASGRWSGCGLAGQPRRRRSAAPTAAGSNGSRALRRVLTDYGGLTRYGSENSELPPPRAGEQPRGVLRRRRDGAMAGRRSSFRAGRYVNRGIAGQNSAQLLLRFRQDVIGLAPAVVVIHAGSNDLARMLGPGTRGTFADNIMSMTELAKAHRIRVVLASILPGVRLLQRTDGAALAGAAGGLQRMAARLCQFGRRGVSRLFPGAGRRPQLQAGADCRWADSERGRVTR